MVVCRRSAWPAFFVALVTCVAAMDARLGGAFADDGARLFHYAGQDEGGNSKSIAMAQASVLAQASGQAPSPDSRSSILPYINNKILGDDYGKLSELEGRNVVFVHPGRTTPTTFSFDVNRYRKDIGRSDVTLLAEIDPRVSAEAIKRGGGTAHIVVSAGGKELGQAVIRSGQPYTLQVPATAGDLLDISVDANGVPDTNWLLLTFK